MGAQVRELEVELAAQDAAFWEAEERATAAEDAEEHMAAIEWRTKQAEAARARDAAADALEQVRRTACAWSEALTPTQRQTIVGPGELSMVRRRNVYHCCYLALLQLCAPERAVPDAHTLLSCPCCRPKQTCQRLRRSQPRTQTAAQQGRPKQRSSTPRRIACLPSTWRHPSGRRPALMTARKLLDRRCADACRKLPWTSCSFQISTLLCLQ